MSLRCGTRSQNISRVLLILTEFPPSFGGMQTHAVYLCRHLWNRGYDVQVATYRANAVCEDFPFPIHRCLSRIGHQENLRVLNDLAARFRPDLLYASTVFYGKLAAKTGIPMIARCAGNDVLRPWIVWPFEPLSATLSQPWLEERLCERFRRLDWPEAVESVLLQRRRKEMARSAAELSTVLANSAYTAGLLRGIGVAEADVRVLPGGVDAARFYPSLGNRAALRRELGLPPNSYVLMTACRLVPKKGLDLLMRAIAALRRRMPDLRLVVAGDGRQLHKCMALASDLGVDEFVTFLGRVPHEDLHRYYWCADQFVLASREHVDQRTGLRDVETMGRVLCEAHAAGVPAIAAESGGIPSIVQHETNGLLFAPEDLQSLTHAVERIRDDGRLALRLREQGLRTAAHRWDWSVICSAHEEEFQAVTEGTFHGKLHTSTNKLLVNPLQ